MDFPTITPSALSGNDSRDDAAPPWIPPALRAVCLDIDDTLVDFTAAERRALARMLGRADMWPLWESVTAAHVRRVIRGELDYEVMHWRRTAAFLAELGIATEYAVVAEFERNRKELARLGWKLFSDVCDCLAWLAAAGVRIAAVTNASGRHQHRKLDVLGIAGYFDCVAVAGELGVSKPDARMFEGACRELGCLPSEAVHVGDKLETDARGARAAGLTGVWLRREGATGQRTVLPDVHVIDGLSQLPELLVSEFVRVGVPVPR